MRILPTRHCHLGISKLSFPLWSIFLPLLSWSPQQPHPMTERCNRSHYFHVGKLFTGLLLIGLNTALFCIWISLTFNIPLFPNCVHLKCSCCSHNSKWIENMQIQYHRTLTCLRCHVYLHLHPMYTHSLPASKLPQTVPYKIQYMFILNFSFNRSETVVILMFFCCLALPKWKCTRTHTHTHTHTVQYNTCVLLKYRLLNIRILHYTCIWNQCAVNDGDLHLYKNETKVLAVPSRFQLLLFFFA